MKTLNEPWKFWMDTPVWTLNQPAFCLMKLSRFSMS